MEVVPPAINFAPLENAATALTGSARRYESALGSARAALAGNAGAVRALNAGFEPPSCSSSTPPGCPTGHGIGICCTRQASTPATA